MHNFYFFNPTKILFGKGMIGRMVHELNQFSKILLLYGGGSIKANGAYQQVITALTGRDIFEFGGIESNPDYETCLRARRFAQENQVDFILAVGGGSVIDAAKFIAMALHYDGDSPWRFVTQETAPPAQAHPLGCVLTLPASGSEMNNALILSRREIKSKRSFCHISLFPRFSVLDPELSFSLSAHQTALGIVDMFTHVLEQYITYPTASPLQQRQAEAILNTLVEVGEPLLANPGDYTLRATVMWCGSQAVNGTINRGVPTDWSTHNIGHDLTALYDIPHAQTLALVLGGVYRHQFSDKMARLAQLGRRVWRLSGADCDVATQAITATESFFERLGVPTRFSRLGLDAKTVAAEMCARLSAGPFQALGEHKAIDIAAIAAILTSQA